MDSNNTFRTVYRSLSDKEKQTIEKIKALAGDLEKEYQSLKASQPRYASLALTDLESSVSWAVKAVTA